MTSKERKRLAEILKFARGVGATAAVMTPEGGYVSHHKEAMRLMDSADYRKGYEYCRDHLYAAIEAEFGVKPSDADEDFQRQNVTFKGEK